MSREAIVGSELIDTAPHHLELRASVSKLVGSFGRKYFQDCVRNDVKPVELWSALGKAGFLGVHVPEQYGGGGGGLADYNVIIEETAAQGCPLLSMVINSITAPIISAHGSAALKTGWLAGLANGTKLDVEEHSIQLRQRHPSPRHRTVRLSCGQLRRHHLDVW